MVSVRGRRPFVLLALTVVGVAVPGVRRVAGADEPPAAPPPRTAPEEPPPRVTEEVVVTAPRSTQGPFVTGPETIETPLRTEAETFEVPYGTSVLTREEIRDRRNVRNMPDALLRLPSTMVQKTGPGQTSPFLRGFTGYHDLLLIDGVRVNNSAFRSGPNQYWSTIDSFTVERLEVARGPHSVLWGSDAVGGTVNVLPRRRASFCPGVHVNGGLFERWASAEDAFLTRAEVEGNAGSLGFVGGVSWKEYGDIESGGGTLPNTGFSERDADLRFDIATSAVSTLSVAWQRVRQEDVPRTHTTVDAVPFHGTTVGTELRRDLDQERDLVYAKFAWHEAGGAVPSGHVLVSWQRQAEEQDRLRTGGRRDLQGFDVETWGVAAQVDAPTRVGVVTLGADFWHDDVNSFRDNYLNGVFQGSEIQGPLGDEGSYDLFGVYVQDRASIGCLDVTAGLRWSWAQASADRVDDPLVPGANPATPGNVISVDGEWSALVASLRALWHVSPCWNLYAGASQAFRAPSLSDLTAFETTSVVEVPAPDLDPDRYLGLEVGAKTEARNWSANAALWYVILDDTIVRSPTGNLVSGVPEVRKDNVGDGWVGGFEVEGAWRFAPSWTAFGNLSWMDGRVDQYDATQTKVRDDFDRLMPLTTLLGARWEPPSGRVWAQAEWVHADKASRLSLQNETDTQRIPPGGTPGYDVLNLRAGLRLACDTWLLLSVENLTDENYRVHGSGVNEPGRNFVLGLDLRL